MTHVSSYSKKVIEHFRNPHNYGKIKDPDGKGKAGNPLCGDILWIYIKVGKNKKKEEIIKDIKFETCGCVAAISSSSIVTDLVKGKTLKEALELKESEIIKNLGGLPLVKSHCSVLATSALKNAIYDYISKSRKKF